MNKTNDLSPATWPDGYRQWTGTFPELLEQARAVLAHLDPSIEAPSARLLRYYQDRKVLGRGQRQGTRSIFRFEDLERVVGAKALIKQSWTLDNANRLMDHHVPGAAGISGLLYCQGSSQSAHASHLEASGSSSAPDAVAVVAQLMARSGSSPRSPLVSGFNGLSIQGALSAPRASLNTQAMSAVCPAPWLHVYIDEAAARRASPTERAQAHAALDALLQTLR